ncbi:ATP-dependent DNA ligase protein [Aurantimonas manganoxydans SI85-9A1]|uniref:Non-homologous end joining protein Ku n=1 Tax=Aurantimonas manganoxydans (strain ATCC BAA-1229 / DSM 21871 / SI85-9A1) TaxID=287752 RepID=Q1YEJ8_AURMS|nr:Ku protein [Aurantimonas manganoxydans]EAS48593.1 ATP-dependent DNA ligase protein [Aurantimonas manganoxydans SI85-9A1]
MAPRPIWKGQIRLSLVSIPVEMFSATQSGASISFRQIHRESGKRIHYDKVVDGIGPVDKDEIVKGYEVGKDDYVLLTDEEIEDVKIETKKTLELVQFVDTCSIPPLYFDKPYYVVPQDELAEDAFRVVRDALRQAKKTGLGQLSLRGKEYLVALRPCGPGLLLETLHYEDEIRKSDTIFSDISDAETDGDLLDVATQLIEKKTAPFDASNFKNHYTAALKALIAEKRKKGGKARVTVEDDEPAPASKGSNVVDLMATLKKSLEGGGGGESGEKKGTSKSGTSSARGSKAKTTAKSRSTKASGSKSTKSGSTAKAPSSRRKSA